MLNDFYTKLNLLSGGKFNKLRIAILAFFCVVASSQIFPQSVNIHFQSAKIHISTHHSNTFPQKMYSQHGNYWPPPVVLRPRKSKVST